MSLIKTVLVRGAGISGISTAYALSKKGYNVVIHDPNGIASKCSYANGGQISVSNSPTWNTFDNLTKSIKWMFENKNVPFYIRPDHITPDKISWISSFVFHTINNSHYENTVKTIEYGLRSRALLEEVINKYGLQIDKSKKGMMQISRNKQGFDKLIEECNTYKHTGWNRYPITKDEIIKLEPNINHEGIVGGTFTPGDWSGDIYKFCYQMGNVLKDQYNVQITKTLDDSLFDAEVFCTGSYTNELIKTNIYPIKGYSITYDITNSILPQIPLLDNEAKIVTSTFQTQFRVAGIAELAGYNEDILPERIDQLKQWVKDNTLIKDEPSSEWACIRPMSPDMLPQIYTIDNNKVVNTGAGHLGWTMSMALAEDTATEVDKIFS